MNSIINDQGELEEKSRWLRKEIFDMSMSKKKGHTPSSFSMVETLVTLFYRGFLKYDSVNIDNPNRDRLIISKGHGAMAAYPILADLGFFPKEELAKFTRRDGILRQYADNSIPGVECVTGSLGHGIGIATGFGLA
ncbi:MAG: transketolase, partial [Nanoarchaeota archaeon]|nr:transketolase [Nanoarchaeota archaeon]